MSLLLRISDIDIEEQIDGTAIARDLREGLEQSASPYQDPKKVWDSPDGKFGSAVVTNMFKKQKWKGNMGYKTGPS